MQNSGQPYRGSPAPGVNYSDHSYENQIGHCQPSGYQPYVNPPYHPIPVPRPHHYGNHQMQQGMPYRQHGGAYAPNQNQYGPGVNQDMYRNHVPNYMAGNRNHLGKPWAENNSSPGELMPPYNQVSSHPQMMNNPPQMPASTMRSPPHGASNMNVTPSGGPQHYRQMQSPAHSPHSWSQAQMPSPGVMHSTRTTPSPLPTHVRSPGHSQQPFSPPSAAHIVNMQSHLPSGVPENGQIAPPPMNNASNDGHTPSNPLHSLQKMVLLDPDSKQNIMPLPNDGSEQLQNQCISQNFVEDGSNSESKDSNYSTYYNLDENRFESKPNNTANDADVYATVQQVSVCNFPVPTLPISAEAELNALPDVSNSANAQMTGSNSAHASLINANTSVLEQNQANIVLNHNPIDSAMKLKECPPHAESAPMFTDQTQASMSTNTEQALNSNVGSKPVSDIIPVAVRTLISSKAHSVEIQNKSVNKMIDPEIISSSFPSKTVTEGSVFEFSNTSGVQIKVEKNHESAIESDCKSSIVKSTNSEILSSTDLHVNSAGGKSGTCPEAESQNYDNSKLEIKSPSIVKINPAPSDINSENLNRTEVPNDVKPDLKNEDSDGNSDSKKPTLRRRKAGANYEEAPSPESELKGDISPENHKMKRFKEAKFEGKKVAKQIVPTDSLSIEREIARNPVKVVIHRIRKSDTNDTWHVPGVNNSPSSEVSCDSGTKITESKVSNVGPQIIILSPAMSEKKFGIKSRGAANSITVKEDTTIETEERKFTRSGPVKKKSPNSPEKSDSSPQKKKGRPAGSKNKFKPNSPIKRRRGKKANKKKKFEITKDEVIPKLSKKAKAFNGPYVHITGSKNNPSSISVINVAQREEEKDVNKIQKIKRNFNTPVNRIKKKRVGHLSTLSPTYDAFNRDKTWLCVFCHKGSHHGGLGDLYGPYYIKGKNLETETSSNVSPSTSSSSRSKRRRTDTHEDSKGSKRVRQNSGKLGGSSSVDTTPSSQAQSSADATEVPDNLREVWLHEDCAVWCQSISLLGEEVNGLEEATSEAVENICSHCSLNGATVGCWGKGCKELYHFTCAKDNDCQMDIQNFSLLCPKHQKPADKRARC